MPNEIAFTPNSCGELQPRSLDRLIAELATLRGIPITTVPRTLFDLAGVLSRRQVERAIHETEVHRLWDPLSLQDLIARYPRARGIADLRAVMRERDGASSVPRDEIE